MTQLTLNTKRLTLRPFTISDAAEVTRLLRDGRIAATTARIPHPYTINDANDWLSGLPAKFQRDVSVVFAITRQDTGELLGSIGLELPSLDIMHGVAELGYWIAVDHQRSGYATEAGLAVIDHGFTALNLRRIEAHTFSNNPASSRVLEKLGMQHEGVMHNRVIKNEVVHDTIHYAILRSRV